MPRPAISLTLKQKLSSLSISPSAPSSPISNTSRLWKKNIFAGFGRNDSVDSFNVVDYTEAYGENDRLDEVMRKVICQAGVDYETRPMVVITACQLPDPKEISYDLLLIRILSYLDLYVENDYTVVFLAAGGRYTPGWNWVWKAYRSLNRKYRKNLKKLFIVHSTMFSKMLFSLAGAIISPKFFRKLQYIPTLSELAMHVPLTQIDIAPEVYQENLKFERQITLPPIHQEASHAFGVPLDELMGGYGESSGLPRVIKDCIEYVRTYGMEVEGIFRRSPNSVLLRQAKEAYDRGQPVSLTSFADPHIAAVLLKMFFRSLPSPVFPESLYSIIRRCPPPPQDGLDNHDGECIEYIRSVILTEVEKISPANLIVLSHVLHLLHDVSIRSVANKMDARNLAICFTPNLVSSSNIIRDTQMYSIPGANPTISSSFANSPSSRFSSNPATPASPASPTPYPMTLGVVIKICIEQYYDIFEEQLDRTTAPSLPPTSSFSTSVNLAPSTSGNTIPSELELSASSSSQSSYGVYDPDGRHGMDNMSSSLASSTSLSTGPPLEGSGSYLDDDDDDDLDESMLIMPIGPSPTHTHLPPSSYSVGGAAALPSPPSAWSGSPAPARLHALHVQNLGLGHPSSSSKTQSLPTSPITSSKPPTTGPRRGHLNHTHHRNDSALSGGSATQPGNTSTAPSLATSTASGGGGTGHLHSSIRASSSTPAGGLRSVRSAISIETAAAGGGAGRGSIRIGAGKRRPSAAGVEAVGVTAAGFFVASPVSTPTRERSFSTSVLTPPGRDDGEDGNQ